MARMNKIGRFTRKGTSKLINQSRGPDALTQSRLSELLFEVVGTWLRQPPTDAPRSGASKIQTDKLPLTEHSQITLEFGGPLNC